MKKQIIYTVSGLVVFCGIVAAGIGTGFIWPVISAVVPNPKPTPTPTPTLPPPPIPTIAPTLTASPMPTPTLIPPNQYLEADSLVNEFRENPVKAHNEYSIYATGERADVAGKVAGVDMVKGEMADLYMEVRKLGDLAKAFGMDYEEKKEEAVRDMAFISMARANKPDWPPEREVVVFVSKDKEVAFSVKIGSSITVRGCEYLGYSDDAIYWWSP